MITKTNRKLERDRRHLRVRKKISGTAERSGELRMPARLST